METAYYVDRKPLKLVPNRVNRSYQGGRLIEEWQGLPQPEDSSKPEEWLASLVEARNSIFIPDEGLSRVLTLNGNVNLIDLIATDALYYLGEAHQARHGLQMAVLTKILDASVRLSIQVHPTKAYAHEHFQSDYGKTEAWYILGGREIAGEAPYVLVGFRPGITREYWKKLFEAQDIDRMIGALHKFDVKAGDVILIEGGLPHAIGSGCFLIEIQEPTDYTMRVERKTFDGNILPDFLCHQGIGFEKMLNCFDYAGMTRKQIKEKCFRSPKLILEQDGSALTSLISKTDTACFSMNRLTVKDFITISDWFFKTCIVLTGNGAIICGGVQTPVKQGETFFLPAGLGDVLFKNYNTEIMEVILCYPPG